MADRPRRRRLQRAGPASGLRARVAGLAVLAGVLLAVPPAHAETTPGPPADATAARGARARLTYSRPVEPGHVIERFQPPLTRFGPGHRGVDLAAPAGAVVHAAARGTVLFAGSVAGRRWVTLTHPDGHRTTYGPLATVTARRGETVAGGASLGRLAPGHRDGGPPALHWSARTAADTYVDPLALLTPAGPWRPTLLGGGVWRTADEPHVPRYGRWTGEHEWWGGVPGSPVAVGRGWPLPPNPNHVIGVAGFGSDDGRPPGADGHPPIDLTHLGYDRDDVTYLSYAGRRSGPAPARSPRRWPADDPRRDQAPYEPADTFDGIHTAALQLREQLRAHAARAPGQAVDLVGHSMGGVVVLHYLLALHDPADPALPPVSHAATIAAPLEGAELADLAAAARGHPLLGPGLRLAGKGAELDADSLEDLRIGSELLRRLARRWDAARDDPWTSPLAGGTRVATFGGDADLVVNEHRSDLPGSRHAILPGTHDGVRRTEASRIALRAFLADDPVPGESGGLAHWAARARGALERLAALRLRVADAVLAP